VTAVPWWITALAITVGSAVGTLLRQAVVALFAHSNQSITMLLLASSSIVGGLLGGAMGAVTSASVVPSEQQGPLILALIAAVGTFGASAVLALPPGTRGTADNFWRIGAMHVALAIFAALVGAVVVRFVIIRSPSQ
jgi:hypothetical protein